MTHSKIKIYLVICGILFLSNIIAWSAIFDLTAKKESEVDFFNVGQGDSAFIQTSEGRQVLIDGGPNSTVLNKLAGEMPFYDRTIDLVILTHPEADHMTGLLSVLKNYKIKNILWTGIVYDTQGWKEWENLINQQQKQGARIEIAKAGEEIILDPGIWIDILKPDESLDGQKVTVSSNDTGVVALLKIGARSFLFAADIDTKIEQQLQDQGIKADVLKVAHHGSKNSILKSFYEELNPEYSVISVGKNNYGHPSASLLDMLSNLGIKNFLTIKNGDIKFFSDGKNLDVAAN